MLFSSFVSIFRAFCRPLHCPSCSFQPAVLFFDFDSTSTCFFLKYSLCILPVSSPLIWPKNSFVALPKYESFRDTTGYVTANASRQRSTILVFPSSLLFRRSIQSTLPSFHPILFFAFNSSNAIVTIHYTCIQIPPTYVVQSTDILYPTIIGENQLPTPL